VLIGIFFAVVLAGCGQGASTVEAGSGAAQTPVAAPASGSALLPSRGVLELSGAPDSWRAVTTDGVYSVDGAGLRKLVETGSVGGYEPYVRYEQTAGNNGEASFKYFLEGLVPVSDRDWRAAAADPTKRFELNAAKVEKQITGDLSVGLEGSVVGGFNYAVSAPVNWSFSPCLACGSGATPAPPDSSDESKAKIVAAVLPEGAVDIKADKPMSSFADRAMRGVLVLVDVDADSGAQLSYRDKDGKERVERVGL